MNLAGSRLIRYIHNRALFHFRNAAGYTYRNHRLQELTADRAFYKILQHFLGILKIRDDAFPQRADRCQILRRPADHLPGLFSDGHNLVILLRIDRHHRGLTQYDALFPYIYQNTGCSEINSNIR